jgi:hypothetical protein
MKGGAYSSQQIQELQNLGISDEDIDFYSEMGVSFEEVVSQHSAIPNNPDDEHFMDDSGFMDNSLFNDSQGSLHLSALNVTPDSMRADTTVEDVSFDNSNISNGSNSSLFSENGSFASEIGGKRRKRKTHRKTKNGRKSRKQRGGGCFGNGVGANPNDPNYSIYNTNLTKLFPYKPQ